MSRTRQGVHCSIHDFHSRVFHSVVFLKISIVRFVCSRGPTRSVHKYSSIVAATHSFRKSGTLTMKMVSPIDADLPYELWGEVARHLRNDDILVLSKVTRSARRATQTVPLTFDVNLNPFRALLLLRSTLVPLRLHLFVHNGKTRRLTDCVYGLDVRSIKGCVVSRTQSGPECWVAGACSLVPGKEGKRVPTEVFHREQPHASVVKRMAHRKP